MKLVLVFLLACAQAFATLTVDFDNDEVIELNYNGTDFAQNVNGGLPFLLNVRHNGSGSNTSCAVVKTLNVDGWSHRCNEGSDKDTQVDAVLSQPDADSFQMAITIYNHDVDDPISKIDLTPLEILNPGDNEQNCNSEARKASEDHGPAFVLSGTWGAWALGMTGFPSGWLTTTLCSNNQTVNFDVSLNNTYFYPLESGVDEIEPGGTRTITLLLRFGPAGSLVDELMPEPYAAFREKFPFRRAHGDSRFWLSWFPSRQPDRDADNPRGYLDITDATDSATFVSTYLAKTDEIIARADAMSPKPRGIIIWSIEGEEFPHAFTYVGDPTAMCPDGTAGDTTGISPEMCYDAGSGVLLVDEIMRRFRAAGYDIGLTLRPQAAVAYGTTLPSSCDTFGSFPFGTDYTDTFIKLDAAITPVGNRGCYCNDAGDGWVCNYGLYWQKHLGETGAPSGSGANSAVTAELARKIQYAYERWGVAAYYADTNNLGGTYSHRIFYDLAVQFPNVLIFPEWEVHPYMASVMPYDELDGGVTGPIGGELALYPQASSFINLQDGDLEGNAANIRLGMRRGSITMTYGWFTTSVNQDFIQAQYTQAVEENGSVTVNGETFTTTIPIVERVSGSCYPHEAAVRCADDTGTLEGCNPLLGHSCEATTTCRSTESPCTMSCAEKRMEVWNSLLEACSVGAVLQ